MQKKSTAAKAGTLYFIGNIFDKAVAFITIPIFTRMLSTADYGVTTTYLSWVSILSVIITLSLGNSIRTAVVDFAEDKDGYMSSIFALGTLSALIMTAVLCGISLAAGTSYSVKLVLLCCVHSYSASIIAAVQWRYMMELNYVKRTALQCLPNLLIIVISVILILRIDEQKYMGRVYAYAIVMLIIGIAYAVFYFGKGRTIYKKEYWKYALNFSLPIIFHSLSVVILSQADRTMITWLKNSSETGIYGLAYQFGMVPLVITTTLENVWIPWFTERMEKGDKKSINEMVVPYINLAALVCLGVMLVAPEVLKFMTTEEYYDAVYMIAPVVLATYLIFVASVSIDLEYYLKKTKHIATNTMVAAIVNIVLNYIFIPMYGGRAAAYTTVVSYVVSFAMHCVVARRMDKELFPVKIYIKPITFMCIGTMVTCFLMGKMAVRWGIAVLVGLLLLKRGKEYLHR